VPSKRHPSGAHPEHPAPIHAGTPLLAAERLTKVYPGGARGSPPKPAVDSVSLELRTGECLGVVGESGSGKTTLADCMAGLSVPSQGAVRYRAEIVNAPPPTGITRVKKVQMVHQDPSSSLNPRREVGSVLMEILRVHRLRPRHEINDRVEELLSLVGITPELAGRRPRRLSGGQQQRVAIARALAFEPEVIIADEVASALDASLQAQILNLLADLRSQLGLSILMITHDMAIVRQSCDRVAVMREGAVVELGEANDVLDRPVHEYTLSLLAAVPRLAVREPARRRT
jgi:ABC-type glutathione transport system ATPase component